MWNVVLSTMWGIKRFERMDKDDHLAAGRGDMKWDLCEFQHASSPQQVADGLKWLAERGLISEI